MHQTLASFTYVRMSRIGEHRLSTFGRGLRGMALIVKKVKKSNKICSLISTSPVKILLFKVIIKKFLGLFFYMGR